VLNRRVGAFGFFYKYYDYAPYGRQIRDELSDRFMTLQFTGHERDWFLSSPKYPENYAVRDYMRARYYSPVDGRFLRPDPAFDFDRLNPASFNLYAYARGNPIAFTDPTGTSPWDSIPIGGHRTSWFDIDVASGWFGTFKTKVERLGEIGFRTA